MLKGPRLPVCEPFAVPDTLATHLVGMQQLSGLWRFTFAAERELVTRESLGPLYREVGEAFAPRMLAVTARLVVPGERAQRMLRTVLDHPDFSVP